MSVWVADLGQHGLRVIVYGLIFLNKKDWRVEAQQI
jgi:hypothetical protein